MTQLRPDGTKQITLSRAQFEGINSSFQQFYKKTKCGVIMLSDASGLAVAQTGKLDRRRMELLSTLTAGNYAATAEMARLIGEDGSFKMQFHEGKENNICVTGVNESFLLTVVFAQNTTFGMVRVLMAKTIAELQQILSLNGSDSGEDAEEVTVDETLSDSQFKDELSSRLNSVLFSKTS